MPKVIPNQPSVQQPVKVPKQKPLTFELFPVNESATPFDEKGVKREPYPAIKMVANKGLAIDEKGQLQEWRYIHAFQKSIWVKDQKDVPDAQINDHRNELVFRRGKMTVHPFETAKIAALKMQDGFAGNANPVNEGAPKEFFLVDQEAHDKQLKTVLDDAFEAEKRAREMEDADLYSMASLFGIDTEQTTTSLRTQLIIKAKEVPKAFLREHLDPKTKMRYMFLQALQQDVITTSQTPGQIVWTDTNTVMCEVNPAIDAVQDLTMRWVKGDIKVRKLAEQLSAIAVEE